MSKQKDASDPLFHYEIWKGPSAEFGSDQKSIYYVENHNAPCGYAEVANDFGMAAELLIERYRISGLGNWVAPVAHMSRQAIELHLKSLMSSISSSDKAFDTTHLGGHNLEALWLACRGWLINGGYKISNDVRLEMTDHIISALHCVDPSGDLFRFGVSRKRSFNKQKSCDRVFIYLEYFEKQFRSAKGLLEHWEATVFRENMRVEMGWDKDPYFDSENFPRSL